MQIEEWNRRQDHQRFCCLSHIEVSKALCVDSVDV